MKYTEYMIVRCQLLVELEEAVNKAMADNWQPIGAPFLTEGHDLWCNQAMGKLDYL